MNRIKIFCLSCILGLVAVNGIVYLLAHHGTFEGVKPLMIVSTIAIVSLSVYLLRFRFKSRRNTRY